MRTGALQDQLFVHPETPEQLEQVAEARPTPAGAVES